MKRIRLGIDIVALVLGVGAVVLGLKNDWPSWVAALGPVIALTDPVIQFIGSMIDRRDNSNAKVDVKNNSASRSTPSPTELQLLRYDKESADFEEGLQHYHNGDNKKALASFEQALEARRGEDRFLRLLGSANLPSACIKNNIGCCYLRLAEEISEPELEDRFFQKALINLMQAFESYWSVKGTDKKCEVVCNNRALFHYKRNHPGDKEDAEHYSDLILAIKEKRAGKLSAEMLKDSAQFASTYEDYKTELKRWLQLLELYKILPPHDMQEFADVYYKVGSCYYWLGQYDKALEVFEKRVLPISLPILGEEHPDIATVYSDIGVASDIMGDHEKALTMHKKALGIREKVLGMEHPDTATSYNEIGGVYHEMEQYEKALAMHNKALEIRLRVLGAECPETATSYNDLGITYNAMGKLEKSLEMHVKALTIRKEVLGMGHPDTASSYANIGTIYLAMGEPEKALATSQKALDISEKVLGPNHPDNASIYNTIGSAYVAIGEPDMALEPLVKALEIRKAVLGLEHPKTASTYGNIGVVYDNMREYEKALEMYQNALRIFIKVHGEEHFVTAAICNKIRSVHEKMGKPIMASAM